MIYAGVDYSMSTPAICIGSSLQDVEQLKDLRFFFLTKTKAHVIDTATCKSQLHKKFCCDQERFLNICDWSFEILQYCDKVFIEDYAMRAKGRVFHIAENCGLLKSKLFQRGISFNVLSPTHVKKQFTGFGRAPKGIDTKKMMVDKFVELTNIDTEKLWGLKQSYKSPVADLVDAYAILKTGLIDECTELS